MEYLIIKQRETVSKNQVYISSNFTFTKSIDIYKQK